MAEKAPPLIFHEYCLDDQQGKDGTQKVNDGAIKSVAIGYVWLYFYHEVIVGVRHQIEMWSDYARIEDCKKVEPEYIPHTVESITPYHFEIISRDFGGDEKRTVEYHPLAEMSSVGLRRISDELIKMAERDYTSGDGEASQA